MADFMTRQQRSYAMSRVRGRDTGLELRLRSELDKLSISYVTHLKYLPGKPDIAFPAKKLAVFIDGDFWHGYRYPAWKDRVPLFWQKKILDTRRRDQRNFRKLRRLGWQVLRVWQHQIKKDVNSQVARILMILS